MEQTADELEQDLLSSCWALERQRLLEDKQSLLDENIQLRKDLLQLQQDHIALLQLVSVQQQQLQQHEAASAKQSAQNRCLQSQTSLQSLRSYQQQVVLRPSSSVRDSLSRESTASPMQFAHKGSLDLSRKQKKPNALQRSIQSFLTPRKSWSRAVSSNPSSELPPIDGSGSSGANSSNKPIIDVAALTGLANSNPDSAGVVLQQQPRRLPRMDSVSSSMQYYAGSSPTGSSTGIATPFAKGQCSTRSSSTPTRSSSGRHRSSTSSPGLIMGDSTSMESRSAQKAGGWRVNRPTPLNPLYTAPAAVSGAAAAGPVKSGLPPHPGTKQGCSSSRYHKQQQPQLETVGSGSSDIFEPQSCPAAVFVEPHWSETPTAGCFGGSNVDSSTPPSSSSSGYSEAQDNSSSSTSSQALPPAASSSSSTATSSSVGSDVGRGSAHMTAAAGAALHREDTAKVLTQVPASMVAGSSPGLCSSGGSGKDLALGQYRPGASVSKGANSRYADCDSPPAADTRKCSESGQARTTDGKVDASIDTFVKYLKQGANVTA